MSIFSNLIRWSLSRRSFMAMTFAGLIASSASDKALAANFIAATLGPLTEPTKATFSIKATYSSKAYIEYGSKAGSYTRRTSTVALRAGVGVQLSLFDLSPGSTIYYRLRYTPPAKSTFLAKPAGIFKMPTNFTKSVFAVQADPHMDDNSSADVYNQTLVQIVKSAPAFLVDLGDIFMVDKLPDKSDLNIRSRFQLMKDFYQKLQGVPLKIVLGNHDGELGYSSFNTKKYRQEYFPEQTAELAYFAFEGPDQLHICLDPFTYTTTPPKADGWQWTLGRTQYEWLRNLLETSTARHKFVYIHHLLVGDAQSRGGVEIAGRNEWGGKNLDGSEGFATYRAGWAMPVHKLLVKHKVAIVFKGHDHLYVKQELDGVIYQTVPQPSHPGDRVDPKAYGYLSGKAIGGSGFLRVATQGASIKVEFVKFDGSIADSYEIVVPE